MASRRAPAQAPAGAIPEPLTDHQHPTWRDPAAYAALCAKHSVRPNLSLYRGTATAPWWARFTAFRHAWLLANGCESTWPGLIDHERARTTGVDLASLTRHRLGLPQP